MKKPFFIVLALSASISLSAQEKVKLTNVGTIGAAHPSCVPTVTAFGDDVTISCDSVIHDVNIVIRDQQGNVLHQSTQTVSPSETTISVANMGSGSEKSTIDLYYDRKHLYGEFDE